MGILNPACTATDGVRIFALAYAPSYNDSTSSYYLLIQSQPYPSETVQYMNWTLISAVSGNNFYYLGDDDLDGRGYGCAVDEKGVFTALARLSATNKSAALDTVARGIQYQPGTATGGGGTWRNVSTSQPYVWVESASSEMYVVKDTVAGTSAVMHVSLAGNSTTSGIAVATLDTNTMTMVQNPDLWTLDVPKYGLSKAVGITANNTMYILGKNITTNLFSSAALTGIKLSVGSTAFSPASSIVSVYNMDSISNYCGLDFVNVNMLPWKDKLLITCKYMMTGPVNTEVFVSNGSNVQQIQDFPGLFDNVRSILPVQGAIDSFIFMYNSSGVYSAQIDGKVYAAWQSSPNRISIVDAYGINPNPNAPSTTNNSSGSTSLPGSGSGTGRGANGGLIGGVCAAIALAIGAAMYVFYVCKRRESQTRQQSQYQEHPAGADLGEKFTSTAPPPVERAMKSDLNNSYPGGGASAGPLAASLFFNNNIHTSSSQYLTIPPSTTIIQPLPEVRHSQSSYPLPPPVFGTNAPHAILPTPTYMPHGDLLNSPLNSIALSLPPSTSDHLPDVPAVPPGPSSGTPAMQGFPAVPGVPLFWEPKPFVPPSRHLPGGSTNNNQNNNASCGTSANDSSSAYNQSSSPLVSSSVAATSSSSYSPRTIHSQSQARSLSGESPRTAPLVPRHSKPKSPSVNQQVISEDE